MGDDTYSNLVIWHLGLSSLHYPEIPLQRLASRAVPLQP